jgi:ribosomal-protein-alanine N-acetyltransferase
MNSFQLRVATLEDVLILLEIEKSVSGSNIYSPMLRESEWREALKKDIIYLIKSDADIIGSLSYEKKNDNHVYISGLVIKPAFQGKGFGRQVLVELLEQIKHIQRIDLVTHPDNQVALSMYRSLGFIVESRKENYYGDGEPRLVLSLVRVQ